MQGAHGMVAAQLHSNIDIFRGGNAFLQNANALVAVGDQDLIDHKAGGLVDHHGGLADLHRQVLDIVHQVGGGVAAGDDLHQLHGGHGVEEVHTDQVMLQALAHLGDGQRGGVGGEDGLVLADGVQLAQQFLLDGHVLGHALDDQIGIGGSVKLLDQNAAHDIVRGFLGHLTLGDLLVQGGGQLVLMTLCAGGAGSIHQGGVALRCENLGNAAAHRTGAEYCYFHDSSSYLNFYMNCLIIRRCACQLTYLF